MTCPRAIMFHLHPSLLWVKHGKPRNSEADMPSCSGSKCSSTSPHGDHKSLGCLRKNLAKTIAKSPKWMVCLETWCHFWKWWCVTIVFGFNVGFGWFCWPRGVATSVPPPLQLFIATWALLCFRAIIQPPDVLVLFSASWGKEDGPSPVQKRYPFIYIISNHDK